MPGVGQVWGIGVGTVMGPLDVGAGATVVDSSVVLGAGGTTACVSVSCSLLTHLSLQVALATYWSFHR